MNIRDEMDARIKPEVDKFRNKYNIDNEAPLTNIQRQVIACKAGYDIEDYIYVPEK